MTVVNLWWRLGGDAMMLSLKYWRWRSKLYSCLPLFRKNNYSFWRRLVWFKVCQNNYKEKNKQ